MNNRTFTVETVFAADIRNIADGGEAERIGDTIFRAAYEKAYRNADKATLLAFLKNAADLQNEKGFVALLVDDTMPRDARVGIIYQPSYAIAAVALYCYDAFRSDFDDGLCAFLEKLLSVFAYGIIGHGFEEEETVRKTMDMLSNESVKRYMDEGTSAGATLSDMLRQYLEHYETRLSAGETITEGFDTEISHKADWLRIVSFWKGCTEAVFVYGTLRRGEHANSMLQNSVYCGKYYLKDCAMYDLGSYPGMKDCKGEYVIGEVYLIDEETLKRLDSYEGEGSLYKRKVVTACNGKERMDCYAYFYCHDVDSEKRMLQTWGSGSHTVWYAAYGSNLSAERFSCYIRGGVCKQNGKHYTGCSNPSMWTASELRMFDGRLYFGNQSSSWGGKGVAFYDENGRSSVQMRLYKITRAQLLDVREQEGSEDDWYGRLVCLGIDPDGTEIYTMTSKDLRPKNTPSDEYRQLLETALMTECGYTASRVAQYFRTMEDAALG